MYRDSEAKRTCLCRSVPLSSPCSQPRSEMRLDRALFSYLNVHEPVFNRVTDSCRHGAVLDTHGAVCKGRFCSPVPGELSRLDLGGVGGLEFMADTEQWPLDAVLAASQPLSSAGIKLAHTHGSTEQQFLSFTKGKENPKQALEWQDERI